MSELLHSWGKSNVRRLVSYPDASAPGCADAAGTLPWRLVVLLICFATLSALLAFLYPEVFGTPLEQF
jgi:hypothetical protein